MEGTFLMHNDQRNLETIPAGALGMIPLESCREIGEKVDRKSTRQNSSHGVQSRMPSSA